MKHETSNSTHRELSSDTLHVHIQPKTQFYFIKATTKTIELYDVTGLSVSGLTMFKSITIARESFNLPGDCLLYPEIDICDRNNDPVR